jgi:uncharacterized protein (DUF2267 family)
LGELNVPNDILDITPDPKVLIALTHTPLKPLDALCELIDNGIDSFRAAALLGEPEHHPLLEVTVPGAAEARRGEGIVRVVDNGSGLDREGLGNSLRAGFSGKNRYDTLGLFGMGFNIATGKLGRHTTVTTARRGDDFALRVVVDLPAVVRSRTFAVPIEVIPKPVNFEHGTMVDIGEWWPAGDPNAGFIVQLASIQKPQLRAQIGRRYATILRSSDEGRVRIRVNEETAEGFEHCVWSQDRFVERLGWGMIPARFDFDSVLHSQRRCVNDSTSLDEGSNTCMECGASEFRTVEERIRGWVGIQRFDDNNRFGIDLIRNGRVIRVSEKDAVFNHLDVLGEAIKEYPTDQQTGRIIGEVHLDHVPVDFQKQDFQRSSEEWQRAITFLRGASLLPSNWPEGARNESPVSKLFQGYRKVRNYGRADMYMGRYDEATRKAVRIGREVETDLFLRFLDKEPGYYDDARWWEYVETANTPPVLAMEECPDCGFQNRPGDDTCGDCGRILKAKDCIACSKPIAKSAVSCPDCGASQIPEVQEPWRCAVCGDTSGIDDERCGTCDSLRGADNPVAPDVLRGSGEALAELSFDNRTFVMADGRRTEPLNASVFRSGTLRPVWNGDPVPTIAFKTAGSIEVFMDVAHAVFTSLGVHPEEAVAIETAQYLYSLRSDLTGRPAHSVQNIAAQVLADVWGEQLAAGPDKVRDTIRSLFERISERLEANPDATDFYDELDQFEQRELADKLISAGTLNQLSELRSNGGYLRFAGPGVVAKFFAHKPDGWFESVWTDKLPDPASVGPAAAENAREQLVGIYARCLDDCAAYLRYSNTDLLLVTRARVSGEYLEEHLA